MRVNAHGTLTTMVALQVDAVEPVCCLASANLLEVQPTFHIARFLPSIKDSQAPFTFVLQVRCCVSSLVTDPYTTGPTTSVCQLGRYRCMYSYLRLCSAGREQRLLAQPIAVYAYCFLSYASAGVALMYGHCFM